MYFESGIPNPETESEGRWSSIYWRLFTVIVIIVVAFIVSYILFSGEKAFWTGAVIALIAVLAVAVWVKIEERPSGKIIVPPTSATEFPNHTKKISSYDRALRTK
ncbi:hypothetical protein AKJ36_03495 [candidate division MSBL1 archaeon SCGC-AAA259I07]|uniref:Uncharacterized protein n=1 Tax=candidate division MSBL1 archaeon SCGC-AAA259I07 TaxID=1698266 RepID=A0A133UIM9_9EURY|nr:hypothetical protein AKJ36_03495 [candidate division MSBL1 archaeon SCGC-AAA259I07]